MLAIQKNRSRTFLALLALPATSFGFALSVQIAALSWILSVKYGLDIHDIGLVWAAGPLAGIFGQVIIGGLSDRVWVWKGRRRPFIIVGGVIASLMLLALPSIDVISSALGFEGLLGVTLVVVLSLDFAINVGFNPTRSLIADVTPPGQERTRGFTWMQTVSGTISIGAYAIGALYDNFVLIYVGAALVFVCAVVPTLFIEEPETITVDETEAAGRSTSVWQIFLSIKPLWGFLIYDLYAMTLRIGGIEYEHYYAEMICGALTIALILQALLKKEPENDALEARDIGFRKVLAAHSFSWIGIQTTFVFMVIFVQYQLPSYGDIAIGQVVAFSMLILTAVAAVLPVLVLEPVAARIGRISTHVLSLASMSAAYLAMYYVGTSATAIYVIMALLGIGWASMISLPFAIMSQKADKTQMGLYMGLFNLSVVLPMLVVSLGVSLAISRAEDKSIIFMISAIALALSAVSWVLVNDDPGDSKELNQ